HHCSTPVSVLSQRPPGRAHPLQLSSSDRTPPHIRPSTHTDIPEEEAARSASTTSAPPGSCTTAESPRLSRRPDASFPASDRHRPDSAHKSDRGPPGETSSRHTSSPGREASLHTHASSPALAAEHRVPAVPHPWSGRLRESLQQQPGAQIGQTAPN